MKATDPDFESRVRDSFARQPYMALLGAELTRVEPGQCELRVSRRHELTQQHGFMHGAVVSALCDDAAAYAAFSLFPARSTVLAVEYKLNFVAPARGDAVRAVGRVLRTGRTLSVCRVDVFSIESDEERLCTTSLHTVMRLENRSDHPPGETAPNY